MPKKDMHDDAGDKLDSVVVEQGIGRHAATKKRGSAAWRIVFVAALLVLIASASVVGYVVYTYWAGQNEYNQLADVVEVSDLVDAEPATLADFKIDWEALKAKNADTVGWIYIPGTVINYPIVWRQDDDQYYLNHSFGDNSVGSFGAEFGCIMLSGKNSPDWTDMVNVVYGHNMLNGSMFATLAKFTSSDEFNAHRTIYILTPEGNFKLTTFAVDKVLGTSTDIVIPNFASEDEFRAYVEARLGASLVTPDSTLPSIDDIKQVFAFSTCSSPDDQYRIITFATVSEYLPVGSDMVRDASYIDAADISSVDDLAAKRVS